MTTEQNKMNLESKHICGYLPYGLQIMIEGKLRVMIALSQPYKTNDNVFVTGETSLPNGTHRTIQSFYITKETAHLFKLLLRPLSSMTEDEKADINMIHHLSTDNLDYAIKLLDYYYQKHLDVHNLIPAGLAIDLNTLK